MIAEMIILMRGIVGKSAKCTKANGINLPKEVLKYVARKLGIVGYGNIGAQLSVIADLGCGCTTMTARNASPLGNAIKCKSLKELL